MPSARYQVNRYHKTKSMQEVSLGAVLFVENLTLVRREILAKRPQEARGGRAGRKRSIFDFCVSDSSDLNTLHSTFLASRLSAYLFLR